MNIRILPYYLRGHDRYTEMSNADLAMVTDFEKLTYRSLTSPSKAVFKKTIPDVAIPYDFDGEVKLGSDKVTICAEGTEKDLLIPNITVDEDGCKRLTIYIGYGYTNIFESYTNSAIDARRILAIWLIDYMFKNFNREDVFRSRFFADYWLNNKK